MSDDYDLINVDAAEPMFGMQVGKVTLRVHGSSQCKGPLHENGRPICCIHNPTDHHMLKWEQNWRADKGVMERMCTHRVGHPDPDDLLVMTTEWAGTHGCDLCCQKPTNQPKKETT